MNFAINKSIHAFLLIFILSTGINAQKFKVDTLVNSGPTKNRINLVILADGYTATEFAKFKLDANSFVNALFNKSPYKQYKSYFNVFGINVISKESGASHPGTATDVSEPASPITTVNNFFGSRFDFAGTHRLLVATNNLGIQRVLADNFPLYDQVLVLVNSSVYGGSGGQIAVSSTNVSANEIAIHEIGHSMINLIDEYYVGDQFSREGVNMTGVTDPSKVKWKNWMGFNGVGIYKHGTTGNSANWYRPHERCIMRFLNNDFCSVCIQGTIEKIHNLVDPFDQVSPSDASNLDNVSLPINFKIDLIPQVIPTVDVEWFVNDVSKTKNNSSFTLNKNDLKNGVNVIRANIEDKTNLLRIDEHLHTYSIDWSLKYNGTTSIESEKYKISRFKASIFPNPSTDFIEVNIEDDEGKYDLVLRDLLGKIVTEKKIEKYIKLDVSNFKVGVYIIEFSQNGLRLGSKKILIQPK
jgi:hypothetical protein